jgi:hypothetical protein
MFCDRDKDDDKGELVDYRGRGREKVYFGLLLSGTRRLPRSCGRSVSRCWWLVSSRRYSSSSSSVFWLSSIIIVIRHREKTHSCLRVIEKRHENL